MWSCRILGHDLEFVALEQTLAWRCTRACGTGGSKQYGDPASAVRYAEALNRRGTDALGTRAPLVGLLPLRLWRRLRADRAGARGHDGR